MIPTNVTIKAAGLVCQDCPRGLLIGIGLLLGIVITVSFWAAYQMYKDRQEHE
jgi:type III secretory pathway component EscT